MIGDVNYFNKYNYNKFNMDSNFIYLKLNKKYFK